MAEITAASLKEAQREQVQEVVAALAAAANAVAKLPGSKVGEFDIWFGGLPEELATAGSQSAHYARALAKTFGVPLATPGPENGPLAG